MKEAPSIAELDAPPAEQQEQRGERQDHERPPRPRLFEEDAGPRVADAILGFLGVLVLLSWLVVAVAHAGDLFGLDAKSGSRMALVQYGSHHLTVYPPLFDGHHLWGTRYLPIPLMLHAALSFLTGEVLTSGKLVSYLAMAAIIVLTYVALRRASCPRGWSIALSALVLLTQAGLYVGTAIVADGVPVALQLGAVLLATSKARYRIPVAALLCVIALFSKQSALWAPAAICIWLWMRDRRAVWRFAVFYVSGVAVLFAMFVLVTHGRFLTVLSLTFSGEHSIGSALGRPITLLYWFPIDAAPIALLLPFAVIAVAHGLRSRHLTPWQLSLIAAAAILLIIWTDVGVDSNHLVDIVVLISLVAGERWARNATTVSRLRADRTVTAVLLVALPWGMLYSYDQLMDRPVRDAVVSLAGRTNRWSLQELRKDIPHGSRMLAEDATVPLILGRQPVVEDAFMVPPIGRSHPEYLGWLVRQVEDKDFDEIVLEKRIDRAPSWWYGSFQFGPQVIDAVATNYRFEVQAGPYFVYTPRR